MNLVREIARFMHYYHYKLADVLNMSAFSFFTLLFYLHKLRAEDGLENIVQVSVPHMEKDDSKKVITSYKRQAIDIIELEENNDYSAISELKKAFNVNRGR